MKIIASDFDGTFRRGDEVTPEDLAAVAKWRAAGNLFGIATGRSYRAVQGILDNYPVDFLVCCGGAALYSADRDLIWQATYSREAIMKALDIAIKTEMPNFTAFYGLKQWDLRFDFNLIHLPDEAICFQASSVNSSANEISKVFADTLNAEIPDYLYAENNGRSIDVVAAGVTKSSGIMKLMEIRNVPKENVFTVGDNFNDCDMIRDFNGFAVARAQEGVKAIASKVYNDFVEMVDDNL